MIHQERKYRGQQGLLVAQTTAKSHKNKNKKQRSTNKQSQKITEK